MTATVFVAMPIVCNSLIKHIIPFIGWVNIDIFSNERWFDGGLRCVLYREKTGGRGFRMFCCCFCFLFIQYECPCDSSIEQYWTNISLSIWVFLLFCYNCSIAKVKSDIEYWIIIAGDMRNHKLVAHKHIWV